jgi:excinuclease ABC subunit B
MMVDESHVALPQVRGMFNGDRARKQMLIDFGFRLPSALDNRPLKFEEFENMLPSTVFVSATPGPYELTVCGNNIVEQVIRPTGLVDPLVYIHPTAGQIDHLVEKIKEHKTRGERSLVLALTKKTAEDLSAYFTEKNIKTRYLHSDIESLDRVEILKEFKQGKFDVLVGINLLREGIDIPQVGFVAILGADNEGFLRNTTTLIQISGRAARNAGGEVVLYADRKTDSIKHALSEMSRRRKLQEDYNKEHGITPKTIQKTEVELKEFEQQTKTSAFGILSEALPVPTLKNIKSVEKDLEQQMRQAADALNFELAAELRDRLLELRRMKLK